MKFWGDFQGLNGETGGGQSKIRKNEETSFMDGLLAGNSFFGYRRIFISRFSEHLGINIEGLNSLLLGIQLFI